MAGERRDLEALQQAVSGNRAALTMLLLDLQPRLRSYIAAKIPARLQGRLDADDIVQETHIQVYRHIARFESRGEGSFDRWVSTIAVRKLRNALTKYRAQRRGGVQIDMSRRLTSSEDSACMLLDLMAAPGRSPSASAAGHEAVAAVQAGLEFLSEDQRRAVALVYLEGWTMTAVAAELQRSEQAVYNLCHRAKERLHEVLQSGSRFLGESR
jgi:RNA polymerase sigma-70 factor (subfamily 1)